MIKIIQPVDCRQVLNPVNLLRLQLLRFLVQKGNNYLTDEF
jgi:hypothetical protein